MNKILISLIALFCYSKAQSQFIAVSFEQPLPNQFRDYVDYVTGDTLYWNHIYHPTRLQMIKADTTIVGTVVKVIKESDGDYHVQVDVGAKKPLNVEIICAFPEKETICAGYNNVIPKPKKGMKVEVVGDYVYDKHHAWYEIHPVKKITLKS
jgi:hypothetical protein